ncbi:hypothetical protein ACFV4N_32220 [Actinosynnema sp. NPDC059797]
MRGRWAGAVVRSAVWRLRARGAVAGRGGGSRVVGFHDAPAGRHLQLRRDGWVTVVPASPAQVAARVREVLDEEPAVRLSTVE